MARDERQAAAVYKSMDERDEALDPSYNLSGVLRAIVGDRRGTMLALTYEHLGEIAETYLREDRGHERAEDHFQRWCVRHFGRVPEPVVRMLLHGEVWRGLDHRDGGTKRPSAGLYDSWADQQQWERAERAAQTYVPGESHVARLEGICAALGIELGPGPQAMPTAFRGMGRYAEHERREELRAQAARLPYAAEPEDEDTLAEAVGESSGEGR